jgi:integrase
MAVIQRKNEKGEVRYLVRVRDRIGRWYPAETFDRMVDAKRHERRLLDERDQGRTSEKRQELRFDEFLALWISQCRGSISAGWRISQDQMLRDYVLPFWSTLKITEIRPQEVGALFNRIVALGRSPQTVKHVYAMLHKIFEDAIEHFELLERNPVLRRYRPKIAIRERAFLTPTESWRLLRYVEHHYQGPAIWLQLLAGLRPGEVQALRWKHVDFELRQILIRGTYCVKEKRLQDHPKQSDWGSAPMTDDLFRFLEARRGPAEQFVVLSRTGGMLSYNTYEDRLQRFCKQAGVRKVTPHELRHSCTELFIQSGASAEDIRRLLNQKSLTATARYMHRTDERLQGIAGRVTEHREPTPGQPLPPSGVEARLRVVR